ncbi:Tryptophan--tRNA ligase, mitochondrial [Puccinia graminis f. sp. tritici]|uniref:Tryptophan--tRNA ligase, mitochondrial n=1 Tax=Puccinia graminis f. sp. tritici TaxID=56615 RepID=A0A5B0N4Y8_PUCGR|nr:Tryptophan--tRNA ligase, mitochondrial [Puccinia graminis f. sp. tritici]
MKAHQTREVIFSGIQPTGVPHQFNRHLPVDLWQELEQVQRRFQDKSVVDLKSELIELLIEHFRPFNAEFSRLVNSREDVEKIYLAGSQKAAAVANLTLSQVKKHIGLD